MTGKRLFYFILSGLFLIFGSIPTFGSGLSSSASIAVTARVEQPVGFQNISYSEINQNLLRAPSSSELQIEIDRNNSVNTFNCAASFFMTGDWDDLIPEAYMDTRSDNTEKAIEPIILTIIIVSQ